jgi:hypothetical protein
MGLTSAWLGDSLPLMVLVAPVRFRSPKIARRRPAQPTTRVWSAARRCQGRYQPALAALKFCAPADLAHSLPGTPSSIVVVACSTPLRSCHCSSSWIMWSISFHLLCINTKAEQGGWLWRICCPDITISE